MAVLIDWRHLLDRSQDRPGEYVILMDVVLPQATPSLSDSLAASVRDCLFEFPLIRS